MRLPAAAAAALAAACLIPAVAVAGQDDPMRSVPGYQPSEFELVLDAFEAAVTRFRAGAEEINTRADLTLEAREAQVAALWARHQPEVDRLAAAAAAFGLQMAHVALDAYGADGAIEEALADMDLEAIVADGLAGLEGAQIPSPAPARAAAE